MVEILNFLKRIQLGIVGLQNSVLYHKTRHQTGGSDDLESLLKLNNLSEKNHSSLAAVSANQHHPQSHSLASHSTKAHSELTGVSSGQHHAKTVAADINLNDLGEKNHSSLAAVSANQHHPQSHSLASHSTKAHSELTGVSSGQHHPQSHSLASHSTKAHSELTGISSGQHHTPGITFNLGLAAVAAKQAQALIPATFTISKVIAYADTAPVGADLKINIKINGSSLWNDADRLIIANGANSGSNSDLDHTALTEGDRITIDIDQVGSSTPGGNDLLISLIL